MISLTVYGKKYKVPSKFEEITLKHYVDAFQLDSEDKDYDINFLAALGKIPIKELKKVSIKEVRFFLHQLAGMIKEGNEYTKKEFKAPKHITVGKEKFFVPEDIGNESYSQFASATQMAEDNKERLGDYLKFLLSIYCLKKDEGFEDIDINERLKLFEKALFVDAWKVHCFFLLKSPEYRSVFQVFTSKSPKAKKSKQG